MDASVKFGVDLKSIDRDALKDSSRNNDKIDRAKASIYAWDDARLQETTVVKKRITKAAVTVQRFIRACISHWHYYNEERLPLLEELKDIERRRQEEILDVEQFKLRGYEEARFDLEAELAMPKEQFEKCQKESKDLKQAIKDEEQALIDTENELNLERQQAKKLGREKHEIESRHTMSRLDVEIPALEAEQKELQAVDDEFNEILSALQAQLDDMEGSLQIEIRHKKRLVRCIAKMLKALEAGGAKAKLINNLKLIIKYKGEEPPPKPEPAAPETQQPDGAATPTCDNQQTEDAKEKEATQITDDEYTPEIKDHSEATSMSVGSASQNRDHSEATSMSTASDADEAKSPRKSRRKSGSKAVVDESFSEESAPRSKSLDNKTKMEEIKKMVRSSQNDKPPVMDWNNHRKSIMRSHSPFRESGNKTRNTTRDKLEEGGFRWEDMHKLEEQKRRAGKSKGLPGRSKTFDADTRKSRLKKSDASFNWETMTALDVQSGKEKKSKAKDTSNDRRAKSKEKEMRSSKGRRESNVAKDGHFSWAFHAKNNK